MKKFVVTAHHEIYEDDYNEGELDFTNSYSDKIEVAAETAKQAIEKYFEQNYFEFNWDYCQIDEEATQYVHYTNLVDEQNCQADKADIKLWKRGERKLYANHTTVSCYEVPEDCKLNLHT